MSNLLLDAHVAAAFGVERETQALTGTERRTYRVGNVVLRYGTKGPALLWKIGVLRHIQGNGFRIERPIPARDGRWIVEGWTAWTFLAGQSATPADAAVLRHFAQVRELDQMLVRVGIRQLSRLVEAGGLEYADEFTRAADVICQLIERPGKAQSSVWDPRHDNRKA